MKYNLIKITNLIILSVILIPGCHKKNRPPYTPYTPSGPSTGKVNTIYNFSSLAIDPDEDSVAIMFDWGDEDTSAWSSRLATGEEVSMSHAWSDSGTYYVKAQAKDEKELTSEWSLPFLIKIVENLPPNTPSIPFGPSIGYIDSTYQFFSSAIDPDVDSIAIRFDWGDGDTSDWSNFVPSGESVTMSHSWNASEIYRIKTQAMDMRGLTSEWSLPYSINIRTPPAKRSGRSNHTSVVFNNKIWVISGMDSHHILLTDVRYGSDGVNYYCTIDLDIKNLVCPNIGSL
ncbi:MAG: PKD domain-containing protein [bacterium]